MVYVLIIVWSTSSSGGGVTVLNQEFTSQYKCDQVRELVIKSHDPVTSRVISQGCYPK